jgi:hypothetical protein
MATVSEDMTQPWSVFAHRGQDHRRPIAIMQGLQAAEAQATPRQVADAFKPVLG